MRAREEESFTAASSTCDLGIDCRSISIMACSAVEITAETTTTMLTLMAMLTQMTKMVATMTITVHLRFLPRMETAGS